MDTVLYHPTVDAVALRTLDLAEYAGLGHPSYNFRPHRNILFAQAYWENAEDEDHADLSTSSAR